MKNCKYLARINVNSSKNLFDKLNALQKTSGHCQIFYYHYYYYAKLPKKYFKKTDIFFSSIYFFMFFIGKHNSIFALFYY